MIQEEFKDLVFKFVRHASVKEVSYIFLFGSVAKGNADRRSDVDILAIFDTDSIDFDGMEAKTKISELALTIEKEFDRNIQVIFTNRNYTGLDGHFIGEVLKEGILLYAKSPSIIIKGLELEYYAMIIFNLENFNNKDKMKIKRVLYGYKTRKVVKGRVYKNEGVGLVQALEGLRVGAGVIVIPKEGIQKLEEEFNKLKIIFKKIDLWLTKDGIRKLRA